MDYREHFEQIPVSTQTFITRSNAATIDLDKLYEKLTIRESIIAVSYKEKTKEKQPSEPTKKKNFLNCITLKIKLDKIINVKIFNNGVFQMTGCKKLDHARQCSKIIINELHPDCYTLDGDNFIVYIISVMRNVNSELGFRVNRDDLGYFIDQNTPYKVPPSPDYMGVKIRIPLTDIDDLKILRVDCKTGDESTVTYRDYFTNIHPDPSRLSKKHFISISVFQNGKVLMSGVDFEYQVNHYVWFMQLIDKIKPMILVKPTGPMRSFFLRI